jgi:hypothetical protein
MLVSMDIAVTAGAFALPIKYSKPVYAVRLRCGTHENLTPNTANIQFTVG